MEQKLMTEREKADITMRVFALEDEGRNEEAMALKKTIPTPAHLAKYSKSNLEPII